VCRKVSDERSSARTSTVKRLSQQSPQSEPSRRHCTLRLCVASPTSPWSLPHTPLQSKCRSMRPQRSLTVETHGLANQCNDSRTQDCSTLRIMRCTPTSHKRTPLEIPINDSHPTLKQCVSHDKFHTIDVRPNKIPTRNRTETQHNLLPPSPHILRMSKYPLLVQLRVTRPPLHGTHESWGGREKRSMSAVKQQWKL